MTLDSHLQALEAAGLIKLERDQPELEYLFRHALVQEAAYNSLLKSDRRLLHAAVGIAIEREYPGRIEELAPRLGEHFNEAGDYPRALVYFIQAGDAASRIYANAEAEMHYGLALDLSRVAPLDPAQVPHLYTKYGSTLELNGRYERALQIYIQLEELACERGDQKLELLALMNRARVYATPNPLQNTEEAQSILEQALELSQQLSDIEAEIQVLWNLMILLVYGGGDQRQAIEFGQRALAGARQLGLQERIAFTLNDLTYAYIATDQWEQASAAHQEACRLWRELKNLPMLADSLANSVLIHFHFGSYVWSLRASEEAYEISRSINNVWGQAGSQVYAGLVYLEWGDPNRAISIMEKAIQFGEESHHPAALIGTQTDLAWTYGSLGMISKGLELAQAAYQYASSSEISFLRVWPAAMIAYLQMLGGEIDRSATTLAEAKAELRPEGLQWFSRVFLELTAAGLALSRREYVHAISAAESLIEYLLGIARKPFLADAWAIHGQALVGLGKFEEARVFFEKARVAAESVGSRRSLWPVLLALAHMEAILGNRIASEFLISKMQEIVDHIAGNISDPELHAAFRKKSGENFLFPYS